MFKSHPDKELKDHLREVGRGAENNVREAGRPDLSAYAFLAGGLHDVAKYTDFFQSHLMGKRVECSDHAKLSSLIGLHASELLRKDPGALSGVPEGEVRAELYSVFVALAIYSHHGSLKGMKSYLDVLEKVERDLNNFSSCIVRQYNDLRSKWNRVKEEVKWAPDLPPLEDLVEESIHVVRNVRRQSYTWREYFDGLMIFSALIDADKHSASNINPPPAQPVLPDPVSAHLNSLTSPNSEVGRMRDQLREWANRFTFDEKVVYLVAPTGSGKTLAGTLAGLKAGKRRLIYSLPFISIIEQTAGVLSKVLGEERVLKFHHLAFAQRYDEGDLEAKLMLAESWDSPVVVTTFESLVSTFLSPRNVDLKRFHNLANSALILDEVQAMPLEYLYLIWEGLREMSDHLKLKVLFMTATLPLEEKRESPVTYVPDRYDVRVRDLQDFVDPETFAEGLELKESTMVEMNTIASANKVFKVLKEGGERPFFLSTRVVPKQRGERIERLGEKLRRGEKVVLVTTQMVEAGVDLDFRRGYRDLGPLDSVIQAAGRVNRNYRERGVLELARVKRGERSDFSLVYGKLSEELTLKVLEEFLRGRNGFSEREVPTLLEEYYREVRTRYNSFRTKEVEDVLEKIRRLDYDEVKVDLIEEGPKYQVFVTLDEEAERVLEDLRELIGKRGYDVRAKLKALRGKAEQYVVKVWGKPGLPLDEKLGWFVLDRGELDQMYDEDLGFVERDKDLIW
jgi:CRISPR-associated endonuclease/helicase Cas3